MTIKGFILYFVSNFGSHKTVKGGKIHSYQKHSSESMILTIVSNKHKVSTNSY